MTPREALRAASAHFGSDYALAQAIEFAAPTLSRAIKLGRPSAEMSRRIEQATGGVITRPMLRPDLFGELSQLQQHKWRRSPLRRFTGKGTRRKL